jgi:hypothetical protein
MQLADSAGFRVWDWTSAHPVGSIQRPVNAHLPASVGLMMAASGRVEVGNMGRANFACNLTVNQEGSAERRRPAPPRCS